MPSFRVYSLIAFLIPAVFMGQCPSGDILLETQEQVDQFSADFSTCTVISGNLVIKGNEVTDLSFLKKITQIAGDLTIDQTGITSLHLDNLESVGGDFSVYGNENIEALDVPKISSIGRNLVIYDNQDLIEISGFYEIVSLHHLAISHNWYLTTIPEFNKLESLTETTQIMENTHLKEIKGFESLVCATGIQIHGNDSLTTIDGFDSVVKILGSFGGLSITVNSSLERLEGFERLEQVSYLILSQNSGSITPSKSVPAFSSLRQSGYVYLRQSNFPKNYQGFENLIKVGGVSIDGLRNVESFTGFNKIETAAFINVENNRNLKTLSAFGNLQETQYEFIIKRNWELHQIDDMKKLTKVGFDFGIFSLAISDFDFISNLKEVGNDYSRFDLNDLPNLQDCSGLSNLIKYGYLLEPTDIDLSLVACSTKEAIAASADTDNDGILDVDDPDDDNDGLTDTQEHGGNEFLDTDDDFLPDHVDTDSDNDNCSDQDEGLSHFQQISDSPVIYNHPKFSEIEAGGSLDLLGNVGNADTFNWQVSQDNGETWITIKNDQYYSNSQSATLEIKNVPGEFHNNLYRLKSRNSANYCQDWVVSRFASLIVNMTSLKNPGKDTALTVCPDQGQVDLLTLMNGTPDQGGQWTPSLSSGGSVFDTSVDAEGTYQYSFSNNNCQIAKAMVTVSFKDSPTAGEDGELTICRDAEPVNLFEALTGSPSPGGSWTPALSGNNGYFDPQVDSATTYTYTVSAPSCSSSSAKVQINLIEEDLNAGNDMVISLCEADDPVDLSDYLGNDVYSKGTWSPELSREAFFDPKTDKAGDYTYTVAINGCGEDQAVFSIAVIDSPNPGVDTQVDLCNDSGDHNLLQLMEGNPEKGGKWTPELSEGNGIFNAQKDAPGLYTYTLENTQCGERSASISINLERQPDIGQDAQLDICENDTSVDLFPLLGTGTDLGGEWFPELSGEKGVFNPQVDSPGVYEYRLETESCGSYSSFVTVYVNSPANSGESASIDLCQNSPELDLFELLGPTAEPGGDWHPRLKSGNSIFNPKTDSPGTYTYSINQGQCGTSSAEISISLDGSQLITSYEIETSSFDENGSIAIDILESGDFEYSLDGENYSPKNRFTDLKGGAYTLYVRETNGCRFLQENIMLIGFDSFFTPNGDGINDSWKIYGFEGQQYDIYIYDRYGKLLKVLSSLDNGWDGTFNGKPMPSDDYWFSLELKDGKVYRSHFSLIRSS
ncbi:T9SS type B sorting domain-containing protein [Salegentibacter sp. F14]